MSNITLPISPSFKSCPYLCPCPDAPIKAFKTKVFIQLPMKRKRDDEDDDSQETIEYDSVDSAANSNMYRECYSHYDSSFQLDHISSFRPDIGVLLNITPDHLNRYKNSFDLYVAAKMKLAMNQLPSDVLIYNYDDAVLREQIRLLQQQDAETVPRVLAYSLEERLQEGAFLQDDVLTLRLDGRTDALLGWHELALRGRHNCGNALAVALCGRAAGVADTAIIEGLRSFPGVEHRLEQVRVLGGVRYINDSKATNIKAVWFALQSLKTPVILILGGRDKGNDYRELSDQIKNKVHTLIAIGEAKEAIRTQIGRDALYYFEADTLEEAVRLSQKHARKGETVLLSPACASFDMFDSYEHRGQVFKQAVHQLEA